MIYEQRRYYGRRRGEENGRTCWYSTFSAFVELIIVILMMAGSFFIGAHWERTHEEIALKEVPQSEYKVKGRVK